jgi:hypothetical protein
MLIKQLAGDGPITRETVELVDCDLRNALGGRKVNHRYTLEHAITGAVSIIQLVGLVKGIIGSKSVVPSVERMLHYVMPDQYVLDVLMIERTRRACGVHSYLI